MKAKVKPRTWKRYCVAEAGVGLSLSPLLYSDKSQAEEHAKDRGCEMIEVLVTEVLKTTKGSKK